MVCTLYLNNVLFNKNKKDVVKKVTEEIKMKV